VKWREAATPTTEDSRKGRAPVRPGGLNGAKLNSTAAKTQTAAKAANNFIIPYDEAVTEGRALIKEKDGVERRVQIRLGELAERLDKKGKYSDRVVARFAKAIGLSSCTVHRYAAVYKAWDGSGIVAPGPVSYAVMRELKKVKNREEIVKENPKITKREAQELRREHEGKQKKQKSGDGRQKETERWLRRVICLANDVIRTAGQVQVTDALRQIVEPALLPTLREAGAAFLFLADQLEHQDEHQAEREEVAA
jgi:hypothetical protein